MQPQQNKDRSDIHINKVDANTYCALKNEEMWQLGYIRVQIKKIFFWNFFYIKATEENQYDFQKLHYFQNLWAHWNIGKTMSVNSTSSSGISSSASINTNMQWCICLKWC